ncbi:hypothetical protein B5S29_g4602 [[Candida] boidinii]|nr:hypothetical protein B5S29_g4602 [[Candida] boidinii]
MVYHWSTAPFPAFYEAIEIRDTDLIRQYFFELQDDLTNLALHPKKNEKSRTKLESKDVEFSDGVQYSLNAEFVLAAGSVSDELELDELAAAELLYFGTERESANIGTTPEDSAKIAYYSRRLYILQIVSYLLISNENPDLTNQLLTNNTFLEENIMKSFKAIEEELHSIDQLIERSKILETSKSPSFIKTITYRRSSLFKEFQVLGEILYGYITQRPLTPAQFESVLDYTLKFDPSDILLGCLVPGLFLAVSELDSMPLNDIKILHKKLVSFTKNIEELSSSPMKALIVLVFLTNLLDWMKKSSNENVFDVETDIKPPIIITISVGAMEQFMSLTADTSIISDNLNNKMQPFYDFRTLLQQHIPRFSGAHLTDIHLGLQQNSIIADIKREISYEPHFKDFCAPIFSRFVISFLSNNTSILTILRDSEEDSLLASESFDLDKLAENADLERLYISLFYLYASRDYLASSFWDNKTPALYSFLQWASRCNSPLIGSSFCMTLSSLACSKENAIHVFNFLQLANNSLANNSTMPNNYSSICWSNIYESLLNYNKSFTQGAITQPNNNGIDTSDNSSPSLELGEDSVIYISSFYQLIFEVATNNEKAAEEFFTSDNHQLLNILFDFLKNPTTLKGATLTVISSIVGNNIESRTKVWLYLDQWIFESNNNKNIYKREYLNPRQNLSAVFKEKDDILGLSILFAKLLEPVNKSNKILDPYDTSFPLDLGIRYRKPGIWPYIEFLSTDIFPSISSSNITSDDKIGLQYAILNVWKNSISDMDPNIGLKANGCGVKDLNNLTASKSFTQYMLALPAIPVMNYMFDPKVTKALLNITSIGIDAVNELPEGSKMIQLINLCLEILDLFLDKEKFYIDEILPLLRDSDSFFFNISNVGTAGYKSFYDILLLNLPFVSTLFLYCGSENLRLAKTSLSLIRRISNSPEFSSNNCIGDNSSYSLVNKNRLLTMLETVDETTRIRFAFMDQLENQITSSESVGLKAELLEFINSNLSTSSRAGPSIAHFFLGFSTRTMSLGYKEVDGTILSGKSLFHSIINIIMQCIATYDEKSSIDYSAVRLSAISLEIILKLCKTKFIGTSISNYLRNDLGYNFFLQLAIMNKKVNADSLWNGMKFIKDLNTQNPFSSTGEYMNTLINFTISRSLTLQLLALEIHRVSMLNSISLTNKYVEVLIDSSDSIFESPKIIEMLDILEFQFKNMIEKIDPLFQSYNFNYILNNINLKSNPLNGKDLAPGDDSAYDLSIVDDLIELIGIEAQSIGLLHSNDYKTNVLFFESEKSMLKKILINTISYNSFKKHHLECLHYWNTLVQVIVNDGKLEAVSKCNFILEVFQSIVPKINDYIESDISYASDLISSCVSLFHSYQSTKKELIQSGNRQPKDLQRVVKLDCARLLPLFKVCIFGIISPQVTSTIRSDLYVLCNEYLQQAYADRDTLVDLIIFIKSSERRLISTICNDSLVADGACKITALLLLETFVNVILKLNSNIEDNFIIQSMLKSNYLLLLIQRLKSADDLFCVCIENGLKSVSLDTLFYELASFRTVLYFMIRFAQSRYGAQLLLHCDIYETLKNSRFLFIDADLGLTLNLERDNVGDDLLTASANNGLDKSIAGVGNSENGIMKLKLSLDVPLTLPHNYHIENSIKSSIGNNGSISYYDIFIPVFQLVSTITISLGPQNEINLRQVRDLMNQFSSLVNSVVKRDFIIDEKMTKDTKVDKSFKDLKELTSLFTLLNALV